MIRNGQPRTSIRSRATDSGRRPRSLLLGVLFACIALAFGAYNAAVASVEKTGVDTSSAALESPVPNEAGSTASKAVAPSAEAADASAAGLGSRVPRQVAAAQAVAGSATGHVVVFETETTAMTVFADATACNNAPELAHTIMNFTDKDITLFADDRCGVELIDIRPGFGSHVAPDQSFTALD